jgi:hypothetical protein
MRPAFFPLLFSTVLLAQQQPVAIAYSCSADDIETLGLSCSLEEPCPVFLELSAVESAGARLFVAGNFHTERNTLHSAFFASEDGGKTWIEPHPRMRAAGLDQIQFVDFQYGFVSGSVTLGSLPRDPFFLVTTDGGKSFRERPVFDEGRIGAILQFHFENKNNGSLVFDRTKRPEDGNRYELHDTLTGGDTWMPRQMSSKPLALKRTQLSPEDRGWRIREDARSKTIRLEQKTDKWLTVATFPIAAGHCKPPEVKPSAQPER